VKIKLKECRKTKVHRTVKNGMKMEALEGGKSARRRRETAVDLYAWARGIPLYLGGCAVS
jgi:hypothetical protein